MVDIDEIKFTCLMPCRRQCTALRAGECWQFMCMAIPSSHLSRLQVLRMQSHLMSAMESQRQQLQVWYREAFLQDPYMQFCIFYAENVGILGAKCLLWILEDISSKALQHLLLSFGTVLQT